MIFAIINEFKYKQHTKSDLRIKFSIVLYYFWRFLGAKSRIKTKKNIISSLLPFWETENLAHFLRCKIVTQLSEELVRILLGVPGQAWALQLFEFVRSVVGQPMSPKFPFWQVFWQVWVPPPQVTEQAPKSEQTSKTK